MRHASILALLLAACGGGASAAGGGNQPPAQTTCPIAVAVATPTFTTDILPALQQGCNAGSALTCHGSPSPKGFVSYATGAGRTPTDVWNDLVGATPANAPPPPAGWKRIAPGDVARSWLIEKVTSDNPGNASFGAYGTRMPQGNPNLCDATVQTLRNWIDRGAPND